MSIFDRCGHVLVRIALTTSFTIDYRYKNDYSSCYSLILTAQLIFFIVSAAASRVIIDVLLYFPGRYGQSEMILGVLTSVQKMNSWQWERFSWQIYHVS